MKQLSNIYELNSRVWFWELSHKYKKPISLANVPDEEIIKLKELGFNCLWLQGVWSKSKASREASLKDAKLMQELKTCLPDLKLEEVSSSPYAINRYQVDIFLGNEQELSDFKKRLNHCGISLVLDFVPNHTALDHPWLKENPDYFIQGSEKDLKEHPDLFFRYQDTHGIFAYGKDPNFPAWRDVVQLNYFNPQTNKAMLTVLLNIAMLCDGLRCDMAMLILKRVQRGIWGERVFGGSKFKEPESEFWQSAIPAVKKSEPEFIFIAEVYWGLENELIGLGFDYAYDKTFYDYLREANVERVKECLAEQPEIAGKKLKFIENHDEARAASVFGPERLKTAAFLLSISSGAHFYHQGQLEGFRLKVPLYLTRGLDEQIDEAANSFYKKLLIALKGIPFHSILWELAAVSPAWKDNESYKNFITVFGKAAGIYYLAAVNYADYQSQCYTYFDVSDFSAENLIFKDLAGPNEYIRNRQEIAIRGLYLDMPAESFHLFRISEQECCNKLLDIEKCTA